MHIRMKRMNIRTIRVVFTQRLE